LELSILALLMVLFAAWFFGSLASRIGYPAVLGELTAGIILGPAVFGLLGDGAWLTQSLGMAEGAYASLELIGHFGVLLMMLYIGMEIDPKELGKASWTGLFASLGGFIMPFLMGLGVMLLAGQTLVAGMFVAIGLGVTALAVNSRIVVDLRILDTRIAHVMLAGALIADTLALLFFAGLLPFAREGSLPLSEIGNAALKALAFFVGVGILGLWVLPAATKLLRRLGITSLAVYFTLLILIALLFGEMAELAGLHAILGTFAAGLFLRQGMLDPKLTHQLNDLVRIVSVSLLAPVFFVLTGFHVSFDVFATDLGLLIAVLLAAVVGKIAGTVLFYLPTGHGWREGLVIGAGMNGRGAVEIILAQIGLSMGVISLEIFSILVFMAIFTTATVPLFLKWGTEWLRKRGELVRSAERRNLTLIIGATPTARALGRLLKDSQPVSLVDSNPLRVANAQADGMEATAGNALENEILSRARAPEAGLVIAITTNTEINALTLRHAKETFMVPRLLVAGTAPGRGADLEALEHLGASVLFGRGVRLLDWDAWFDRGEAQVARIPLTGRGVDQVVGELEREGQVLPMALERKLDGGATRVEPWHSGAAAGPNDVLLAAIVREAREARTDRFDDLLVTCPVLDLKGELGVEDFFGAAAKHLAAILQEDEAELRGSLTHRETLGSTVLTDGLAVPHVIVPGQGRFALLVARCLPGVRFASEDALIHAVFVLAGSADQRNFHLRALSAIAQIWQGADFESRWRAAEGPEELRRLLIEAPRQRMRESGKVSPGRTPPVSGT
jgi:Kef-type K+ transport system membrane component KefB/mannitol/fructose-specific phosphotransferase system IIA component (Ntr-type)